MPLDEPRHRDVRKALRIIGPAVAGVGLIFTIIGFASFFSAFGSFGTPRYFWCAFVGLPMLGIGLGLTKFAYLGAVTRYLANETAPVGKDVVNYLAHGTRDAVRDVAAAVGKGLRGDGEASAAGKVCSGCAAANDADAKFCKGCGAPLTRTCSRCAVANDGDARFCDACGHALA